MRLSTKEYKKRKASIMERLRIGETEYAELIKGSYEDGASRVATESIMDVIHDFEVSPNFKVNVLNSDILDDWDFVWYYKRNLHIVLPEIEGYMFDVNGIDCSVFESIDKDIEIDTVLPTAFGPKVTYIRLIKRNVPVCFKKSVCNYTVQVIHEDGAKLVYQFVLSDRVRKIFIEKSDACINCDKCTAMRSDGGVNYVLRPRFREECGVAAYFSDPFGILSIIANVANVYVKREKLVRSKKKTPDTDAVRNIMIARSEGDNDTERVMPLFDYVHEYRESTKQEWKGGHHASPVSHTRSGYWRKSNRGTHILKDGKFIEVGRGLGKYIYVESTIVNAHKDSVIAEML